MPTNTYGFAYPAGGGLYDVPTDLKAAADSVGPRTCMSFASAAERDATLSSPGEGMMVWLRDVQSQYIRTSSGWERYGGRYIVANGTIVQLGARYLGWFSIIGTTNASGDWDLMAAIGTSTNTYWNNAVNMVQVWNGDGIARSNANFGLTATLPVSYPFSGNIRARVGNTGAAVNAGTIRYNMLAIGW